MKTGKPETKSLEPSPKPRSARELAQAMFAGADRKLPATKRKLTKSLEK